MARQPKAKTLSYQEVKEKFTDEQSAIDYLAGILWQNGVTCGYCHSQNVTERKGRPNYYRCNECKRDFTIRVGTIFHRSHIPLHKWIEAMYLVVRNSPQIKPAYCYTFSLKNSVLAIRNAEIVCGLFLTARKGISSRQLATQLGIAERSAWFLEQRIRAICGNMTDKILSGIVEVDEAYLGGKEKNKHSNKRLRLGTGDSWNTADVPAVDSRGVAS